MSGPLRFPDEAAWLQWREGKIGGSLIGAVLGVDDAWETPLGAYYQLIGLAAPIEDNLAMRLGRLAQRLVAQTWGIDNGADVIEDAEEGEAFDHPDEPRLSATLDYRTLVRREGSWSGAGGELLEVKVTGMRDRWADGPPRHVEAQARWQLGIVRANGIHVDRCQIICCTVPGWRIQSWPVDHDEAIWTDMRDAAIGFLHNHVDRRRPPKAVLADLDRLTVDAGTDATPLIATGQQADDIQAAAADYEDRRARARETQADADESKALLYQLIGEHTDVWAGDTDRRPLIHVGRQARTTVALKGMDPWLLDTLERRGHVNRTEFPTLRVNL